MSRLRLLTASLSVLLGLLLVCVVAADDKKPDDKKPGDDKKAVDDKKPSDDKKDPPAAIPRGTLPPNWKKIGLTDDQVKAIYKIEAIYRAKIDEMEARIKEMKAQERTEMEKLLTDAQKARLKELKEGTTKPDNPDKTKAADKNP